LEATHQCEWILSLEKNVQHKCPRNIYKTKRIFVLLNQYFQMNLLLKDPFSHIMQIFNSFLIDCHRKSKWNMECDWM